MSILFKSFVTSMLVMMAAFPVQAEGPTRMFLSKAETAQGHFRTAVFYLRTGNNDMAAIETEALQASWAEAVATARKMPSDLFLDDPSFEATLNSVSDRIDKGLTAIDSGEPKSARKIMMPIRLELADFRRRNGIFSMADCVITLNKAMEPLWAYYKSSPDFELAEARHKILGEAAVYRHWLMRCDDMAAPELKESVEFRRLIDGALVSVGHFSRIVKTRSKPLLISVLGELKSFDRLIFFSFG